MRLETESHRSFRPWSRLSAASTLLAVSALLTSSCIIVSASDEREHEHEHAREYRGAGSARAAVTDVLDDFHLAASEADGERYFGHMTADAVFMGTDASERWTRDEFREYADPFFSKGMGWTYTMTERHVAFDDSGRTAWFDERLWNDKYGECRGTGVLVVEDGWWRIAHYNLTIPMPNDLAADFVAKIREVDGTAR